MNGYPWPPERRRDDDDPGARARFLRPRRLDFAPDAAVRAGRLVAQPAEAPRRGRRPGPAAAPSGRQHLWIPLGPVTVVEGDVIGLSRVAGRVRAIDVHPEGERIYAASANGGVWYSGDGATTWQSLGGFASTNVGEITRPAHRHACGAIFVDWGTTAAGDSVYVGTGESSHDYDAQPGGSLGGIGILVSHNPVGSTLTDPWSREGRNLLGNGVNRIAMQPGGTSIVAATTIGLLQRPEPADADADWARVAGDPFGSLTTQVSDVLWTEGDGTRPERLWVWVEGGPKAGLWVRAAGETGFTSIPTAGFAKRRGVLASATPPDTVYVLNDRHHEVAARAKVPAMYRVTAAGTAKPIADRVFDVPDVLDDQGFYDMAIAVDPGAPARVVVAGATFDTTNAAGVRLRGDGAILIGDVGTDAAGRLTFGPATPPVMIGVGVHADVHDVAFSNDGDRLWASCDGGVYRCDDTTLIAGFRACNDGLSVIEANYVASHPTCEGYVVAGLQDNGIIERLSTGVWRRTGKGDGGGVVFDPLKPDRFFRQYHSGDWVVSDDSADGSPLNRVGGVPAAAGDEAGEASAFYSTAAAVRHVRIGIPPVPVGQLLVGTYRPWFSRDMGTTWVTLPTATDPLDGGYNETQDSFGQSITVCRWQSGDVAWLLGEGRLERLSRVPESDADGSVGKWNPRQLIIRKGVKNKKDETSAEGPIRDANVWTDIAVNLEPDDGTDTDAFGQQRGAKGAVYLGTTGHPTNEDVDTLWWFDGDETWYPTGLRKHANGVKAPVTAIVCDQTFPDEVYVGTTVGVWRGTRTLHGSDPPTWEWESRLNGLPEAAVEDLALFASGGLRLLRAAVASRGVWELRLDVADLLDRTYVRAHDDDLRYRIDAVETKRDAVTPRSWHGSPDVRPREAPRDLPAPASLPWDSSTGAGIVASQLRRFQAAFRSQTGDLRCRATGTWDLYFEEVLRDNGAPVDASGVVSIDADLWNAVLVGDDATAEPWSTPLPAEADLYDLTEPLVEREVDAVSCGLPARPAKVDVVVHHRGLGQLDGSNVRVTLLQWRDPRPRNRAKHDDARTWPLGEDVPWAGAVNDVLNSAGATTAVSLAATGWSFVGSTAAARRKTLTGQTLHNERAGIATFDLDLAGVPADRLVILVAVIRDADPSAIPATPLKELALSNHRVAVRSLKIGTV